MYANKLGPWKFAFLLDISTLNASNHTRNRDICNVLPSQISSLTPLRESGVANDARQPRKKQSSFLSSARNSAVEIDGPEIVTLSLEFNVVGASAETDLSFHDSLAWLSPGTKGLNERTLANCINESSINMVVNCMVQKLKREKQVSCRRGRSVDKQWY